MPPFYSRPLPAQHSAPSDPAAPPPPPPSDDAIEALILQATSARVSPDGRPLRDTRTQLFVGNLPYRVRWQDLKDLFRKAGTVLRADVSLGPDNRSRGYGTVLLATAEDAGRAVDMFNGYSWQTRILEVRLDRLLPEYESSLGPPMGSSSGASTSTGSSSHPSRTPVSSHVGSTSSIADEIEYMAMYHTSDPSSSSRSLFVGNLPFHCQWQDLKDLFRQAGTILRADVALSPEGRSRGFGTVVFATDFDAERAMKMFNGYEYHGRVLKVHFDRFSLAVQQPMATGSASSAAGSGLGSPMAAPPTATPATGKSHQPPGQLKLPTGFMYDYDYGSASGPSSPYELFTQLQQQMQMQQLQQQHQQQQLQQQRLQLQTQIQIQQQQQQQQQNQQHQSSHQHPQQTQTQKLYHPQAQSFHSHTHPSPSPLQRLMQPQLSSQSQAQTQTQTHQRLATSRSFPSKPPSSSSAPASSSSSQLDRDIDALASTLASSTLAIPRHTRTGLSTASSSSSNLSAGVRRTAEAAGKPPALSTTSSGSTTYTSASTSEISSSELLSSSSVTSASLSPSLGRGRSEGSSPALQAQSRAQERRDVPYQQSHQQQQHQQQRPQHQHFQSHTGHAHPQSHPHHPGPIAIPPPLSVGAFQLPLAVGLAVSPHTPHAASPLHHPTLGSPYHFYPAFAAGEYAAHQQQQQQMGVLTPQGLLSITPSMPPFTFSAPQAQAQARQRQQENRRRKVTATVGSGSGSGSASASGSVSVSSGSRPASETASEKASPATKDTATATQYPSLNAAASSSSASASSASVATSPNPSASAPRTSSQEQEQAHTQASFTHAHPMHIPLPSPGYVFGAHPLSFPSPPAVYPGFVPSSAMPSPHGLYAVYPNQQQQLAHQQQAFQQQQQAHQLRLNLSGVHGSFSPGVAMSPGTFYGRPGEIVPNPNPWINAAVGAPVHVGAAADARAQGPGQQGVAGQASSPSEQGQTYTTHGAYFYAMSSPKKELSGHEPKGYFDPMYFPAGASGYMAAMVGTSSGLVNEVEDEGNEGGDEGRENVTKQEEGAENEEEDSGKRKEDVLPTHAMSESGLADDGPADAHPHADAHTRLLEGSPISRTHSVGYTRKPAGGAAAGREVGDTSPPPFVKSDSDPAQGVRGWSQSVANAVASEANTGPLPAVMFVQELRLPARVPWRTTAAAAVEENEEGRVCEGEGLD